jgi:transposase
VDGPLRHRCARMRLLKSQTRPSVNQIIRIGMDTSKHIFQLHGVDAAERPVLRKRLRRKQVLAFFAKLPPTVIGMEACGASHYWARELGRLGHEVKLIAPQHVKPYVRRNKNDGRDAEGTCEAMSRPTMRFVPVKTAEQQAALMLAGIREQLIARRTQLSNTIRGYGAEFGVTAAKGLDKIEPLLAQIAQDENLPALARELFATAGREYARLQAELKAIDARLMAWHRANACSRRLAQIPGVGPIGATTLVMKTPDPRAFPSGRHFAAWLGLTPKDHSTAGKTRLGKITRAGDEVLRSLLVAGATAVIQQVRNGRGRPSPWLIALLKRKPPKLAAVALANKIARIAWKLMTTGESYDSAQMPGASTFAA